MTPGERVYALLSANAGVSAIVSTRIYPLIAPQTAAFPRVVYSSPSGQRAETLTGHSASRVRMQIDAYATTYLGAQALADAIDAAFDTTAGLLLRPVRLNRIDLYEDALSQGTIGVHHVSSDFSLWIQE